MLEAEYGSVQRLAAELLEGRPLALRQAVRLCLEAGSVEIVTEERVPHIGHVNPDLVGPTGLELASNEARDRIGATGQGCLYGIPGDCVPTPPGRRDGHLLAVVAAAGQRRRDGAADSARHPPDQGEIRPLQRTGPAVVRKLRGEAPVGSVVLGRHEEPRRILIEPVHDPRPTDASDPREALAA